MQRGQSFIESAGFYRYPFITFTPLVLQCIPGSLRLHCQPTDIIFTPILVKVGNSCSMVSLFVTIQVLEEASISWSH